MVNKVPFIGVQYIYSAKMNELNVAHLRAVQDVGFLILHPEKGVYIGHDLHGKKPLYMQWQEIARDRPIPMFASEYDFGFLPGISPNESNSVHMYQVGGQYHDGKGTTTISQAIDTGGSVLLKSVKFPDGTFWDYHKEPEKIGPVSRVLNNFTIPLPFFITKPPIA